MAITGRRPTLTDCGCEATVYADGSGIEMHYCPMHKAAKQMLEALTSIVHTTPFIPAPGGIQANLTFAQMDAANAAIKAAGG